MRFLSTTGLVLIAFTAPLGCSTDGGQTGDLGGEHSDGGETGGDSCKETRVALASLGTKSPLGFSAAQVLALAEGTRKAKLVWREVADVNYGPETGESELSLTVTPLGTADYVTSAVATGSGDGTGIEIGNFCPPPRLEIAVHAELSTDGGAFAEAFDTSLAASSMDAATISHDFNGKPISGQFAIGSIEPEGAKLLGPSWSATLFESGMTGTFGGSVEVRSASAVGVHGVTLAVFPGDLACASSQTGGAGLPLAQESGALGLSGAELVEAVEQTTPTELTWKDGSTTELTLSASLTGNGCLRDSLAPTATFPIQIHAVTSDGKLDGTYDADLRLTRAHDASGAPTDGHDLVVEAFLQIGTDEIAKSGFSSVSVPPAQDRLGLALALRIEGGAPPVFSLTLNGQKDADCVKNPPPCSENSCPGCEGTHITTIESGKFGNAE